ncbi:MAG: protein translocase subunit SecF [bacterium]
MEIIKRTNFDFLSKSKYAFIASALLVVVGIVSLIIHKGPNLGIDFTGGTLLQIHFEKSPDIDNLRLILSNNGFKSELQNFSKINSVIIRVKSEEVQTDVVGNKITNVLAEELKDNKITLERVEFVGPAVGKHLRKQASFAIFFSLVGIIIYVAIRFKAGIWGFAGVVALIHDVFITLGLFSVLNKEITLTTIAALLTLAGYSINDTIVVFDRIRENLRLLRKESLGGIINRSLNETLSRTIITSLTVLFPLVAIYFFGGEVLHDFSVALIIGVGIGTYSTLFIATPLVYIWNEKQRNIKR